MWHGGPPGLLAPRALEPDDVAALESLYVGATDPSHGAVTGQVLTTNGDPVFGAHVVALDPQGIVAVASFTERDGSYTLPWLAPGLYYIYAEPLHPSLDPAAINRDYYEDMDRNFRTTFLGGNSSVQRIQVSAGRTLAVDRIRVGPEPPALTLRSIGWSPDGSSYSISPSAVEIAAGGSAYLAVAGSGLDTANQIGVTGRDVTIDGSQANWATTSEATPPWLCRST
jgi:hypothetical protein